MSTVPQKLVPALSVIKLNMKEHICRHTKSLGCVPELFWPSRSLPCLTCVPRLSASISYLEWNSKSHCSVKSRPTSLGPSLKTKALGRRSSSLLGALDSITPMLWEKRPFRRLDGFGFLTHSISCCVHNGSRVLRTPA